MYTIQLTVSCFILFTEPTVDLLLAEGNNIAYVYKNWFSVQYHTLKYNCF